MGRPVLYVLAGVNGAGKSSIGGYLLERTGLTWFDLDTFARELMAGSGCDRGDAERIAGEEGLRRLDEAIVLGRTYAFETTLGSPVVPARLQAAARSHDVLLWFCGLASPELHLARVKARAAAGGHDIPEAAIRERFPNALRNLIALVPHLTHLRMYDNSVEAPPGAAIPDPVLVAEMAEGALVWPADPESFRQVPPWAWPVVEAVRRKR